MLGTAHLTVTLVLPAQPIPTIMTSTVFGIVFEGVTEAAGWSRDYSWVRDVRKLKLGSGQGCDNRSRTLLDKGTDELRPQQRDGV